MKVARTVAELRSMVGAQRSHGKTIGFVPTMGALHEGHLSLVRAARAGCDVVVLSIFVNPLQFGPREDLAAYPRPEKTDLRLAEDEGVDIAFLPSVDEMYGQERVISVEVGAIGDILEGAERPGHFAGVATVVAKLFNIVEPDVSYFGQKDAQQVAVVRLLLRDLSFRTRLEVVPTVREPDGLALSSRNAYLNPDERRLAPALYAALQAGQGAWAAGERASVAEQEMLSTLTATPGVSPGYAKVVDPGTFGPPDMTGDVLLVIAAKIGKTRLIDNILCTRS
jgi:pantoate--beta-alanine ligase